MIVYPQSADQASALAMFLLKHAYTQPTPDMKCMAWAQNDGLKSELCMVVAFNAFMGKTCQLHVAMAPGFHFTPKEMLRAVFHHAFIDFGVKKLLGIVNSNNQKAINYDEHLGFTEEYRLVGMHDDGGDIVLLSMTPERCRYIDMSELNKKVAI